MTDADTLQDRLARFANESGYTILEWIAMWRAGRLDKDSPVALDRYENALELEREFNQVATENE